MYSVPVLHYQSGFQEMIGRSRLIWVVLSSDILTYLLEFMSYLTVVI